MDLSSSSFQRISLESEENNAHNSLSDQIEYGGSFDSHGSNDA